MITKHEAEAAELMLKKSKKVPGDFIIAGKKKVSDWQAFKTTLAVGSDTGWEAAYTEYFHARLWHRYLEPIKTLQQRKGVPAGEGFSIVAIQCSLIEYLESTIQGKSYIYSRNGKPPVGQYEYTNSGAMFEYFLANRPPFKHEFSPQEAHNFYVNIRCGVLHEARTKNGWTISAKSESGQMIDANLKIVYRDNFHAGLESFTEWYKKELSLNQAFQEAFIRKFDSLCL